MIEESAHCTSQQEDDANSRITYIDDARGENHEARGSDFVQYARADSLNQVASSQSRGVLTLHESVAVVSRNEEVR
jgi:hypothetical protein